MGIANLYDADKKEAIWMEDGFCVSQQKLNRDKVAKKGKETTTTDVILLQTPTGRFEHIVAAQRIDLTDFATAKFKEYYSQKKVNIVLISDGARNIKSRCQVLFGEDYVHILDGYHLQKKVKALRSMITPNKDVKIEYVRELNQPHRRSDFMAWQGT